MRRREEKEDAKLIPWGPSIAFAAWMTALFGQNALDWYMSLF
jgi:prepilin signal peptidase PulO-like enzyme (type II secretory pathway)